jgi:hypothetical protein
VVLPTVGESSLRKSKFSKASGSQEELLRLELQLERGKLGGELREGILSHSLASKRQETMYFCVCHSVLHQRSSEIFTCEWILDKKREQTLS